MGLFFFNLVIFNFIITVSGIDAVNFRAVIPHNDFYAHYSRFTETVISHNKAVARIQRENLERLLSIRAGQRHTHPQATDVQPLSKAGIRRLLALVPFNDRKNNRTTAQFQLGYRGMLQLAQRSGEYKRINAMAVKEGELIRYDAFMDEIELKYIEDEEQRQSLPTIGYFAMFEYHNGFRKVLYWSKAKMEQHALTYSQGYRAKKGYTFWEKDFDAMGIKTMLRQLLSKWGMMSLEMQKAYEADGGVLNQDGTIDYVDSVDAAPMPEPQSQQSQNTPVSVESVANEVVEAPAAQPEPPLPDEPPVVDDDEFASLMG